MGLWKRARGKGPRSSHPPTLPLPTGESLVDWDDSPVTEMSGHVVCNVFGVCADAEECAGLECVHPV